MVGVTHRSREKQFLKRFKIDCNFVTEGHCLSKVTGVLSNLHWIKKKNRSEMRILILTCLPLIINLTHGQNFQGYQLGETQNQVKRQNNIYQFLQHVLASSSSDFSQNNYKQNFPQDLSSFSRPVYSNRGQEHVVVNVNQPNSKPTTIINNVQPEFFSSCPCERYVRGQNGALECLCPRKQIFRKCSGSTVCVLKNVCDNGLLFDTQYIPQKKSDELCNESTHTCCLPPVEVRKETTFTEAHQNYNKLTNSSVDTVNKYIITGDVYINNGNPVTKFKTENEGKIHYNIHNNQEPLPNQIQTNPQWVLKQMPNQVQTSNQGIQEQMQNQVQSNPQGVSLSAESQQDFNPEGALLSNEPQQELNSQLMPENQKMNTPLTESSVPEFTNRDDSNSAIERLPNFQTIPPNLVRPTSPPIIITTNPVVELKIKEELQTTTNFENLFTSEITTYKPIQQTNPSDSVTTNAPETTTDSLSDLFQPNEIEIIFGTPNQLANKNADVPTFPGLSTSPPVIAGGLSYEGSNNKDSAEPSVGVSLIENIPALSQMDFPQYGLQAPMKKPEIFLSGKIEKLRNNSITNTTTANRTTQGIGTRIFSEVPQPTKVFPTHSPAINQVQEDFFKYQEAMPTTFIPPNNTPSRFITAANTNPILKTCPLSMKCVQNRYCTPEGFVSTVPVIITKDEEIKKDLLLNCGDESSGQIGKCCIDRNA